MRSYFWAIILLSMAFFASGYSLASTTGKTVCPNFVCATPPHGCYLSPTYDASGCQMCGVIICSSVTCDPPAGCTYPNRTTTSCGPMVCAIENMTACPDIYMPVCGTDGKTYPNSCYATSEGVGVAHQGACTGSDQCVTSADCPQLNCTGSSCPAYMCVAGQCVAAARMCSGEACASQRAIIDTVLDKVLYIRNIGTSVIQVSDLQVSINGVLQPCGWNVASLQTGSTMTCTLPVACPANSIIMLTAPGSTDQTNCQPSSSSTSCPTIYSPVCGADGKTYSSECFASAAGVKVVSHGACTGSAQCNSDADCPQTNCYGSGCPSYSCVNGQCIATTSLCTDSDGGKNYYVWGRTTSGSESVTDYCADNTMLAEYYCENNTVSGVTYACPSRCLNGACVNDSSCPAIYDPVCGTDGRTYSNSCYAGVAGINIASHGACVPSNMTGAAGKYLILNDIGSNAAGTPSASSQGGHDVYSIQYMSTDVATFVQVDVYSDRQTMLRALGQKQGTLTTINGSLVYTFPDNGRAYYAWGSGNAMITMGARLLAVNNEAGSTGAGIRIVTGKTVGGRIAYSTAAVVRTTGFATSVVTTTDNVQAAATAAGEISAPVPSDILAAYLAKLPSDIASAQGTYEYDLSLQKGWNLVSSPVFGGSAPFSSFASNCQFLTPVWRNNPDSGKYERFTSLSDAHGAFWIKVTGACIVKVTGNYQNSMDSFFSNFMLKKGWNMIGGIPSSTDFASMQGCTFSRGPYAYDPAALKWTAAQSMDPGMGYIVYAQDSCYLTLGNDTSGPPQLPQIGG